MKIAHINLSDVREGVNGAVRTLMEAQRTQGDEPVLFSKSRRTQDKEVFLLPEGAQSPWQQSLTLFEAREGITGISADALLELWRQPEFQQADIVHLHITLPDYFSWLLLPSLAAKPLVWSVYDSQPYTAGCYHTALCERWRQQGCRECPRVAAEVQKRQEELYFLKKAIYGFTPMAIVTPNPWLTDQVKNSILSARFAAEIPVAINPFFFKRANRLEIRHRLSIPPNAFVVAVVSHGGLENTMAGGPFVRQVLEEWKDGNERVVLLQIGGSANATPLPSPFVDRAVPYAIAPEQRSLVLQAADVFLQLSPFDTTAIHMVEAAAAGVPSLAFPATAPASMIRHLEDGYVSSYNAVADIAKGLKFLRSKPKLVRQMGDQASRRVADQCQAHGTVTEYRRIYEKILADGGRDWNVAVSLPQIPEIAREGMSVDELWEQTGIRERVDRVLQLGKVEALWEDFHKCLTGFSKDREWERGAFVDLYLAYVIHQVRQPMRPVLLVELMVEWMQSRKLPQRCGQFCATEKNALQYWTKLLRQSLETFLRATPIEYFMHLTSFQQGQMINLWRTLFLNDFTTPYLEEEPHRDDHRRVIATTSHQRLYPDLLIRSMYSPYPPENVRLDMGRILKKDVPIALQVILAFWSVNVPYYDGDMKNQGVMRRNASSFLKSAMQSPELVAPTFYTAIVEHFVPNFWRAAYFGDNLVKDISLFGDFLHQQMERYHPAMMKSIAASPVSQERRLRIGYISGNFRRQAVSFYMANRIIFADRQRFEVQIFSLGTRHDNLTDQIKACSDRFVAFSDPGDLAGMAETIKNSALDILIYADIGMDQISYQLAAMRLAPLQCVLVGHGVTTGLPTIDYYMSGDFEAPIAQTHYREQLIRLPNLGAAQMPPPFPPAGRWTRASFNLPEDAVLLVSCANGIKHGRERDDLLVRILQQAPEAVIALKPFMDPSMVQPKWIERIQTAARKGGVEDRMRVISPLPKAQDMMDFLSVADIQLDTFPYGGWTTNMEAMYIGLAVVTQEGEQARSRWGAHMLRALGIEAGIAKNEDEYVQQAVNLVKNTELRETVRRTIRERVRDVLFNGAAAQPAYEQELLRIHAEAVAKNGQQAVKE